MYVGPGSQLKRLLGCAGLRATKDCGCDDMAAKMDGLGPKWCRNHAGEILDTMRAAAQRRGLPFSELGAGMLLRVAIRLGEGSLREHERAARGGGE